MKAWFYALLFVFSSCDFHVKLDGNSVSVSPFVGTGIDEDGDGFFIEEGDCDDNDPLVFPGATEICDEKDNNCDGALDEADDDLDPSLLIIQYRDSDFDGYGDNSRSTSACIIRSGYSATGGDCNDTLPFVYPGAPEKCDTYDNDCNGLIDEDDPNLLPSTWYYDFDSDNAGDPNTVLIREDCFEPPGYVPNNGDCNDTNASLNQTDLDADGYTSCGEDCDDEDSAVYPLADEICDDIDNDCDGLFDAKDDNFVGQLWYTDSDNDGFGDLTKPFTLDTCSTPLFASLIPTDCNDNDPLQHPERSEICNNEKDDNCNGIIDCDDVDCSIATSCPVSVIESCVEKADASIIGETPKENLGFSIASLGNLDNTPGFEYAYTSRSTLYLSNGQTWAPANNSPLLGVYSIGDLNRDNRVDFLVGTEQESYLFFGSSNITSNPISLPYQAHDASAITGSSENIAIVDTDHFYFHGTSPWNIESSTPLAKTVLTHDVNGDGIDEIFFSSPQARLNQGEVYVLFDHAPLSSVEDITGIIVGEEFTGATVEALPDINNDGYKDIAIGAPLHNNAAGTVYLFTKILDIEQPVDNAPFRLFGTQENERVGSDISVSDFDMDGYVDFAISAPRYSDTSSEDGIVYLVPGEFLEAPQGSFDLYSNAQHIRSPYANARLGEQVEFLNEELLVSAPNLSIHAPDAGALYHFTLPILGATSFTLDEDADGFGRQLNPYIGCYRQENHIADQTDCNDNNPSSSPVSPETCQDGEDNNCNLLIDNADCACSNSCVERCTDNIDNDLDSLTDCDDLDCAGTSTCGSTVIYDTGIATRIFLPGFAEPCLDSSCWENVQERCSLEIAAEGEIRIPIGANSYEKCSFTEESVYRNERESPFENLIGCSLLPLHSRDLTIDEGCSVQDDSLFPTQMEADRFGFPDKLHFNNDAWYPLYAIDYSYSNGYLWTAAIKTRYAK